jgi:hypothetical protein
LARFLVSFISSSSQLVCTIQLHMQLYTMATGISQRTTMIQQDIQPYTSIHILIYIPLRSFLFSSQIHMQLWYIYIPLAANIYLWRSTLKFSANNARGVVHLTNARLDATLLQ